VQPLHALREPEPAPDGAAGSTPPPGGFTPDGRPIRKVRNPELEGEDAPGPALPRRAISFELGPKKRHTGRWLIGGAVALLVATGLAGVVANRPKRTGPAAERGESSDPAIQRLRDEGLALLARDDAASLERGAAQLDEGARREPGAGASADRALALALLALDAEEEARRTDDRARALDDLRAAATGEGDPVRAEELAREAETARAAAVVVRERAGRLVLEARAVLDGIPEKRAREVPVLRARAMLAIAAARPEDARRIARDAQGVVEDPWIQLAGALADLSGAPDGEDLAKGAAALERLADAHPGLLRARFLAAQQRYAMGDSDGASADAEAVLRANPAHLDAKQLRERIAAELPPTVPPPPGFGQGGAASTGPAPAAGSRAEKGAAHPRKAVTQGAAP
jgi:hypothetical protein